MVKEKRKRNKPVNDNKQKPNKWLKYGGMFVICVIWVMIEPARGAVYFTGMPLSLLLWSLFLSQCMRLEEEAAQNVYKRRRDM